MSTFFTFPMGYCLRGESLDGRREDGSRPLRRCQKYFLCPSYKSSIDSSFFLTVTFILTKMDGHCDLLLPPTSYRSELSRALSGVGYFSSVLVQSDTFQMSSLKMSQDYRLVTWLGISLK